MRRWTLLSIVVICVLATVGCSEQKSVNEPKIESLAGFITIEGNTLFLDRVEAFIFIDEYLATNINPLHALNINDEKRFAEVVGFEWDGHGMHYVHHLGEEIVAFELTDETIFSFVDFHLLFETTDPDSNRKHITTLVDEFLKHFNTHGEGQRSIPVFIQVSDGKVLSVTEEFGFTM